MLTLKACGKARERNLIELSQTFMNENYRETLSFFNNEGKEILRTDICSPLIG